MATLGRSFDPRRNSLNFLRLVLALTVLLSHSVSLGSFRWVGIGQKTDIGLLAVYGFFGLSGYLIAGSAENHGTIRFLWQRFLRIFPAFWVCLFVTAFGFGTLAWFHSGGGSAWTYLTEPGGPIGYVTHNFFLKIDQLSIKGTLESRSGTPYWDGSLWTLYYEFLCYLILGTLALLGLIHHRAVIAALTLAVWTTEIIVASVPSLNAQVGHLHNVQLMDVLEVMPIFLTGAVIYLYRDELPDSGWLAIGSATLLLSGWVIPLGSDVPGFTLTSVNITAVFIVFPLLWLGMHLPFERVGSVNDYSYGIYIYAFPIQQLLALWGVALWGFVPYTALTVALTGCAAAASWWLVEKRALRLKSWTPRTAQVDLASETP